MNVDIECPYQTAHQGLRCPLTSASALSGQGLRCPFIDSLDTAESIDG